MKMLHRVLWMAMAVALFAPSHAIAQPKEFSDFVTDQKAAFDHPNAKPGDTVTWRLSFKLDPLWHTYSLKEKSLSQTQIKFKPNKSLKLVGALQESPEAKEGTGDYKGKLVLHGDEKGSITFEALFEVVGDAEDGQTKLEATWKSVICDANSCLPLQTEQLSSPLTIGGKFGDFDKALAYAKKKNRRIFISFTAETDTNSKINESSVFSQPEVERLMSEYTILQMYTDVVPSEYQPTAWTPERNRQFQAKHLRNVQLPLYVIIEPDANANGWSRISAYDEGKINNESAFKEFLQRNAGLGKKAAIAAAAKATQALIDIAEELEDEASANADGQKTDLLTFILSGVFWGAISLVTPCVFPMIPITVSFFLKQAEREGHRPYLMASVYSGTIIIVLTIGAVVLLSFFQALIQHWAMNLFLGALFVFFALSLFGMYDIELPSGLARYTSAHEGQGGLMGTIFMALTFTVVSFACVAPMLGGFAGLTATAQSGFDWLKIVLGALAFSATFASPFFVLALFPSLLKAMPKSGSWLNVVKVVMGFIEIAAALKFLRAGELLLLGNAQLLTFDLVLGGYIAISILCGIYLLNWIRLPHDSPQEHIGVPRLVFAAMFIVLGLYLTPGLYVYGNETARRQRPAGTVYSWVESFILPDGKHWIGDFDQALADAREKKRRIFIDFTGKT